MFSMKIFKLIFIFIIVTHFMSCASNYEQVKFTSKIEPNSNYGRFLSARYSLKVGDNHAASELITKSKSLHLDLTLAELNFNSYLMNGDFYKAKEFKLIAPYGLEKLTMYDLPDFIINLKNGKFLDAENYVSLINDLPGFITIFNKINNVKLVETNEYEKFEMNLKNSNIFNLLIFENTKIENQIHLNMQKTNLSFIENILYLGYLKRKQPKKFEEKINDFSLKFNYDIKSLKSYFENEDSIKKK